MELLFLRTAGPEEKPCADGLVDADQVSVRGPFLGQPIDPASILDRLLFVVWCVRVSGGDCVCLWRGVGHPMSLQYRDRWQ